jgi:hypothetical protein
MHGWITTSEGGQFPHLIEDHPEINRNRDLVANAKETPQAPRRISERSCAPSPSSA